MPLVPLLKKLKTEEKGRNAATGAPCAKAKANAEPKAKAADKDGEPELPAATPILTDPEESQPSSPPNSQEDAAPAAQPGSGTLAPGAASGAHGGAAVPPSLSFVALLESDTVESHIGYIARRVTQTKAYVDKALLDLLAQHRHQLAFEVPTTAMLIPPLAITGAGPAGGTPLSAFREVMNFDNLTASFAATAQYEAAGTIWMLDAIGELDPASGGQDPVTLSQLESATWLWSEEAFAMSSVNPQSRRFSFDVPLPARVTNAQVAQRASPGKPAVLMAHALPMLAGQAHVLAWYGAMAQALQEGQQRGARHEVVGGRALCPDPIAPLP